MKIFPLGLLVAGCLLPAAQADATAYVRDATVYLTGTEGFTTEIITPFVDFAPIASLATGDTISGTISFKSSTTDKPVLVSYVNNSAAGTLAVYLVGKGDLDTVQSVTAVDGMTSSPLVGIGTGTNNYAYIPLGGLGGFFGKSFSFSNFSYTLSVTEGSSTNVRADRFEMSNGNYVTIDDTPPPPVIVSRVPEPATWATMVGGFGLVGSALRRRGRTAARFA